MKLSALMFAACLFAAVFAGAQFAGPSGAAFGLFALLTVAGGLVALFQSSATRGATGLCASLLGTAGLFLLLGSDFLAMAQVLLGVGGLLALVVFAALFAEHDPRERNFARILALLLIAAPIAAFIVWQCAEIAEFTRSQPGANSGSEAEQVGIALLDPTRYAAALQVVGVLICVVLVAAARLTKRANNKEPG